jgi:hypothetical protein
MMYLNERKFASETDIFRLENNVFLKEETLFRVKM